MTKKEAVVESKVRDQTRNSRRGTEETRTNGSHAQVSQVPADREGVQNAAVASVFAGRQPHDSWILYVST